MALKTRLLCWGMGIFILGSAVVFANSGEESAYHIHITDVQRVVHKNWLRIPHSVDYTVYWELYRVVEEGMVPVDVSQLSRYRIVCGIEDDVLVEQRFEEVEGNFCTFLSRDVGKRYGFVAEGYIGEERVVVSDTAWAVTGRLSADGQSSTLRLRWHHWIPFNGRIPLALIGREKFFDGSTRAGKVAFHLIWNFFLAGAVIWLFFCIRYLRLSSVFPLKKGVNIGRGYDEVYRRRVLKEFKNDVLERWRDIVERANEHVRQELKKEGGGNIEKIEDTNVRFWRDEGAQAIRGLKKQITELKLDKYPTVKIIQAGLENHELGGFRWLEASKEVDRAIENRASSELERLRRKSYLDWLWNLGTLAPLVGLFGTATGISSAFGMLTFLRADVTQVALVKNLAGGIYEALWTTIEGLFVGILMMLLYYYYQNKLSWIYSKWEEIYVYVAEKL